MNGIEKITARIEADGLAAAEDIRHKAELEAADIADSFKKEADRVTKSILDRGAVKAKEREEGLISLAQMETKKMILAAKQEVLEEAFALARKNLAELAPAKKLEIYKALAEKASVSGAEEIILNAADKAAFGEKLTEAVNAALKAAGRKGGLTLAKETAEIDGGVILKENSVEVNCSYDTLIRLNKKEIAGEVAKGLFA
ncbi:MAG: V-type ATP synthase subunit E [Verrucomicrobia bacterium]|nr:V-type ATP synthase subunit E [Verrucomicrobiota bacterium]